MAKAKSANFEFFPFFVPSLDAFLFMTVHRTPKLSAPSVDVP